MWERLKSLWKEIGLALIVAAIVGALGWAYVHVKDRVTSEPLTANLNSPDGQMRIRPLFDRAIKKALANYCGESAWVQWLGDKIWNEQCRRIAFEPHTLADMETRRLPFKESAPPIKLMLMFVDRHKDCLTVKLDGDTYRISQPKDSKAILIDGVLVCP